MSLLRTDHETLCYGGSFQNTSRSFNVSNKGQLLQDPFLNLLRKEHVPVSIYLVNGIKLQGHIEMNNIPYNGGSPAVIAVISNESQLLLTLYSSLKGPIDSGKLKPIGVTGSQRIPQLPNVPTLGESGLPGYEIEFWVGVFAPAKTPAATVQALGREIVCIVNLPEVKERFVSSGYEVVASTPEKFAERVRRDTEKYRKIILETGMQQL